MYQGLKKLSSKLIKQFGQPCAVRITEQGKYNPATGERKQGKTAVFNGHCVVDTLAFDFKNQQSPMVKQGDVMIYLTAECQPELNAKIYLGDDHSGEVWEIISIQPIKPAGTTLIYQCQARKGYG